MSDAIVLEGLSKRYRMGGAPAYGALRDSLQRAFTAAIRGRRGDGGEPAWLWALDDVSAAIAASEVVGLLGRNGSGKSTLLKILSRITEPTRGRALVRGRVASLLEVGTGFHPELTGRENVFVSGAILGMTRREITRKLDEIVAFAAVERFVDTPVKHYSSGMQVRLAFAVAAHLEPDILLVDEVLAVGDAAFQKKCLGRLDAVARDGRTVVLVSHQTNQLRRLCTRCLWLDAGRLVAAGPTADITNRYEASLMDPLAGGRTPALSSGAAFLDWTLGPSGSRQHTLTTFGPCTVRFRLLLARPVRDGHHGLALYDRDGRVMWGAGQDNLVLAAGLHEIVYELSSLPLQPGPYRWHVSLFDQGRFITNLDCAPELSIETLPQGHRRDEFAGVVNLPHTVTFRRADDPSARGVA